MCIISEGLIRNKLKVQVRNTVSFLGSSQEYPFLGSSETQNSSILPHLVPGPPFSVSGFLLSISVLVPLSHTHHLPSRPDRTYLVLESFLAVRSNSGGGILYLCSYFCGEY